jgi:UDP-GlcNAc:undecaprenyl-phosphate/decaprenyl-phosphate GlcNAc-1-phosphate transferase
VLTIVQLAVCAAIGAALVALLVGLNAGAIGRLTGLLDFPDGDGGRKRHAAVTPLVGGIGVAAAAAIGIGASAMAVGDAPAVNLHLWWFGAVVAVMYGVGLTDDRFALGPKLRLGITLGILLLAVVFAPDFSLPTLRFTGFPDVWILGAIGDVLALLALLGLVNAINMADGKNGVVIGMCLVWTAILAFWMPLSFAPILAAVGAALAVLLGFNMKSRLFLGDSGSYALSGIFGLLAIYTYNHAFATVRADHVAALFLVPVLDTIRLMSIRIARGGSPFAGDREHFHHYLWDSLGWPRGLFVYLAVVALPNVLIALRPSMALLWLFAGAGIYVLTLRLASRRHQLAPDAT